ncbi:MAG TPA: hypothetical protein VFH68_06230 [Polyangia bacterium]|nr:hypothetical protein [Polyangia bacterium]
MHTDAVVPIALAHAAELHTAKAPGYVHAERSVPLQVPRQVVPVQAGRVPRGVPVTGTH